MGRSSTAAVAFFALLLIASVHGEANTASRKLLQGNNERGRGNENRASPSPSPNPAAAGLLTAPGQQQPAAAGAAQTPGAQTAATSTNAAGVLRVGSWQLLRGAVALCAAKLVACDVTPLLPRMRHVRYVVHFVKPPFGIFIFKICCKF